MLELFYIERLINQQVIDKLNSLGLEFEGKKINHNFLMKINKSHHIQDLIKHKYYKLIRKNWRQYAKCLGEDLDIFFNRERVHEALAICNKCEVKSDCLKDATYREQLLRKEHIFGVVGGLKASCRKRDKGKAAITEKFDIKENKLFIDNKPVKERKKITNYARHIIYIRKYPPIKNSKIKKEEIPKIKAMRELNNTWAEIGDYLVSQGYESHTPDLLREAYNIN